MTVPQYKVLLSAYGCEPNKGSEPGVGWNTALAVAKFHRVWVITRSNNREAIEAELSASHCPNLNFVYYDLPRWARWWKRGPKGVQLYYYLWQVAAYFVARRLHSNVRFDLIHHITWGKYWAPSFLALLPVPFVFGPVGGAESAPASFWQDFGYRGWLFEMARELARSASELDPFVRATIRKSSVALAKTEESAERLRCLGAQRVELQGESALSQRDVDFLAGQHLATPAPGTPFRFVSIGVLLHLKGFHLGLKAFAEARIRDAEYWIIGNGPEKQQLVKIAETLGVRRQLKFLGLLPRREVLMQLKACDALVHPSLHDSGGWVCLEAMAAGKPVICLDLGGPGVQVNPSTGFKVPAIRPDQVVHDLALIMKRLEMNRRLGAELGAAGRAHVSKVYTWGNKGRYYDEIYRQVINETR